MCLNLTFDIRFSVYILKVRMFHMPQLIIGKLTDPFQISDSEEGGRERDINSIQKEYCLSSWSLHL
jgi:hypothetical protein